MGLGNWIDAVIAEFSPSAGARRLAARISYDQIRQYDAAARDRRTQGWRRPSTGANAEILRGQAGVRDGVRELVRNNKYASAALRQMTANLVGDGIAPQFSHDDKAVAQKAQDAWDRWAESRVDGFGDFYEVEKLAVRSMIEGGESLITWRAVGSSPDARVEVLEGDYIDSSKIQGDASGARIVSGVQLTPDGDREGYWLFDSHPGDMLLSQARTSRFAVARNIDHVFERTRPGQVRGISWLASVALTLRDIEDIADAVRLKKKVQSCVALILTPAEGNTGSPLSAERQASADSRPDIETLRPGMIVRSRPGESATTLNPTTDGDSVDFIRHQLAGVAANLVPYYLMTGDVEGANYTSLRASNLGHYANLDDQQQNIIIPRIVRPAVDRRMRVAALELGDRRLLQVKTSYALPVRRVVDPVKDLLAEIMEIRAGLKLLGRSLAERGLNAEDHLAELAKMNSLIDQLGLALDSDPRRLTDSGVLQAAAGYIAPKGAAPSN